MIGSQRGLRLSRPSSGPWIRTALARRRSGLGAGLFRLCCARGRWIGFDRHLVRGALKTGLGRGRGDCEFECECVVMWCVGVQLGSFVCALFFYIFCMQIRSGMKCR